MRIGVTYLYTIFKHGYPPAIDGVFTALKEIAAIGFHFLEMEGLGEEHTLGMWERRREAKALLDDLGMHVHNFCCVDPALVSMDQTQRRAAYDRFKRAAELGGYLGAETLHLASYAPPVEYLGRSPYQLGEDYEFADRLQIRIPPDFCWQKVWNVLVESCQTVADISAELDRIVLMEPRVGEVICNSDSMLRLIHDVGRENFKANFDTGHFNAQRENIPIALTKLQGHYANVHVADNNPVDTAHLPIGEGTIDWREVLRVLKSQEYDGYLGLDLGGRESIESDLLSSRERLCQHAEDLGIPIEY